MTPLCTQQGVMVHRLSELDTSGARVGGAYQDGTSGDQTVHLYELTSVSLPRIRHVSRGFIQGPV